MRLTSENFKGNLHDAAFIVNERGVARFLFSLTPVAGNNTVAIFRFEDYPSYTHFCKRMDRKPLGTKEYFGDVGASYDTRSTLGGRADG